MKHWQEYYLAKCIEKHFGELDEIWHTSTIMGGLNIGDILVKSPITKVYTPYQNESNMCNGHCM